MRRFLIILFILLVSFSAFPQAPGIQWQRCLGGTSDEFVGPLAADYVTKQKPIALTSDNGYIIAGQANSNDGDISGNHGGGDLWVVRLDQNGSMLWKKCLGGSLTETIGGVCQTPDQGFIVVGTTTSNDGDVSGNHGGEDVWVIKLNAAGVIVWQKCLGGSKDDEACQVKVTADGGYIIAGLTKSLDGDVTGVHIGGPDSTDAWLVKLNATGSLVWQKCLGGSDYDAFSAINLTSDGGFICAINTKSNNGDVSGNHGGWDIWIVKLDAAGNISWQKCYGGASNEYAGNIQQIAAGGFFFVGVTNSNNNGDVSGYRGGAHDGWVVKLDPTGTIIWQKCLGGSFDEGFSDFLQLANGDLIVCGEHQGPVDGDITPGLHGGLTEIWVLQVSGSTGTKIWDRLYGGSGSEEGPSILKSIGEGYIMLGVTSTTDQIFDVTGHHGSLQSTTYDLWLVKMASLNTVTGIAFDDLNRNGVKDAGEIQISGASVQTSKINYQRNAVTYNGLFINSVDTGNYTTTITYSPYYNAVPASKNSVFTTYNNKDSFSFALQPIAGKRDLIIAGVALQNARPGFSLAYDLWYNNIGTDTVNSGVILFKKDSRLNFVSSNPSVSSVNGDTLKWNYSNLKPFDNASIVINMQVPGPPTVNLNDSLSSMAIITPVQGDLTPLNDTVFLRQKVVNSYDPNVKTENFNGAISSQQVISGNAINYVVRFQNVGTDTANLVTVRDTLDPKLDWTSFQMISASHPYQLQVDSGNKLTWKFNNIKLPDSTHNEPASHGFITYLIKPKNNLLVGDVISNSATIYFDFNLPVKTNIQQTQVVNNIITAVVNPNLNTASMVLFPNPSGDKIWVKIKDEARGDAALSVLDLSGKEILHKSLGNINLNTGFITSIDLPRYPSGLYIIRLNVGMRTYTQKVVVQ